MDELLSKLKAKFVIVGVLIEHFVRYTFLRTFYCSDIALIRINKIFLFQLCSSCSTLRVTRRFRQFWTNAPSCLVHISFPTSNRHAQVRNVSPCRPWSAQCLKAAPVQCAVCTTLTGAIIEYSWTWILWCQNIATLHFYRAMHFTGERGLAIACCLSVCLYVTLVDCDHVGWKSWKLIARTINTFALCNQKAIHLFPVEHGEILGRLEVEGKSGMLENKSGNISEMRKDRRKVTMDGL